MPRTSPTKGAGHHSDPSTSSLTPLRGDFLSVSSGIRSRSLSPRKRLVKQPLHIRMNLTETQMDKLTDAFSQKVSSSPTESRKRGEMVTPETPQRNRRSNPRTERLYGWSTSDDDSILAESPTFSELMPGRHKAGSSDPFSSTLAGRRHRAPPPPIQTGSARRYPIPQRTEMEAIPDSVSPLSQQLFERPQYMDEDSTSQYSQEARYSGHPEPLEVRGTNHSRTQSKVNNAVISSYKDWAQMNSPSTNGVPPPRQESLQNRPRRSKSNAEGLRETHAAAAAALQSPPMPQQLTVPTCNTPLFSPLQLYFRGPDFPTVKKGEKTMIGDNGWLERTEKTQEKTKKVAPKKTGILDSIKQIAKDMAADFSHNTRRSHHPVKERPTSHMTVSLNAREQSLFYCELEFHLSTALNDYIAIQFEKGRLAPDKFKRVADAWTQKGRPKVVGFRYDLETQLDLVSLHIDGFRFYGRRQADPIEIAGLLHSMKVNARALSVRTFCQPDPVIAKQLVDSQSLFKLIGVPDEQQRALEEIAQFFKVVVERELDRREQREYESRGRKSFQVKGSRPWEG
ncbi:Fc.00g029540.m01.CDS01 [Cosmosporella sp. VM-42]